MDDPRAARLVQGVLRCYPARWRRRHGDEAAELAALLIGDGTPAVSVAWSYLAGAAREWVTPRPGRRLSTVACALLAAACLLGLSAGLLASAGPARAASTTQARPSTTHARPSTTQGRPSATQARPSTTHARPSTTQGRPSATQGRPSAHCEPGSPEPVPGAIPAVSRPQVIIGVAGHGRSC